MKAYSLELDITELLIVERFPAYFAPLLMFLLRDGIFFFNFGYFKGLNSS
jgi:hypothetical protein